MRPYELTLEGFRSYRARTTFDFRGRRLIGIVGPIGAGKSSILDGVAFALYGKTPAFERDTRSLIHQLSDLAQVQLVFEVDGQIWRITRGLRRRGQSGHKLERLASDEPGAEALETVERERPTRERVTQLLGMDFDAFSRSVLLAQNRFADFLKASPGSRDSVLKGVFGYERLDAALAYARIRVGEAEATVAVLQGEGSRLSAARASLVDARAEASAASERAASFEQARPTVEGLTADRAAAATAQTRADEQTQAIERAASSIPTEEELAAIIDGSSAASETERGAAAALADADAAVVVVVAERDASAAAAGDLRSFAELVTRMEGEAKAVSQAGERRGRAETASTEAADAAAAAAASLAGLAEDLAAAEQAYEGASTASAAAQTALHEARHAEMAGELRGTLAIGEPCPVCAQPVATLPPAAKAPAIRTAQRAVDAAAKALTKAEAGRDAARAASAAADGRHVAAQERAIAAGAAVRSAEDEVRAAEATLAATKSEVVDRLGEGDPKALLDERERELREADARLQSATAAAAVARSSLDAARRDAAEAAATLSGITARLAGAWGLLGETRTPVTTTEEIRDAFGELVSVLAGRHGEATAAMEEARAALSEAEAGLTAQLQALGLGPDGDFIDASAAARAERAAADERLLRLEQVLADGDDLDRRLMKASEDLALIRRLRDELQPSRFLAWLLAEERAALAELGSVHLEELTAGGYRFTDDDSFRILDLHAGGAERSSDSLSGGETFLASLALALALAEMVARGGGRLDAFFLDEGFGSLDPDHIERAMDGIGRLVATAEGRLVVLVSHVDLMRQMIEDLIVLEKDERTGQTVVVSGAARDTG